MVDNFALALIHGLLALAAWRLLSRPDLDEDPAFKDRERQKRDAQDRNRRG